MLQKILKLIEFLINFTEILEIIQFTKLLYKKFEK